MQRALRLAAAFAATSLVAVGVGAAPAAAATNGVGTALASTKVLSVELGGGDILSVALLTDEARATIDKAVADPGAYSRLSVADISSNVAPAINSIDDALPRVESRSPGGKPSVETATVAVSLPPSGAGAGALASGSVTPARLTSALDAGTARAALDANVANLNLVGGLLDVAAVTSSVATTGAPQVSDANRTIKVDAITVLDLSALLEGLGIDITSLSVDAVVALVEELGLPVSIVGLPDGSTLEDYVAGVRQSLDQVEAAILAGDPTDPVDPLLGTLNTLLDPTGLAVPDPGTTLDTVRTTLDTALNTVLSASLTELINTPLLRLEGVEVSVATKAVDTLDGSTATVTGKIGKIYVGGQELPGVDLLAAADTINSVVATVTSTIGGALSAVDPGLANLVSVSLLQKSSSVEASGGYNRSRAGITGASVTITPPANLAAIVSTVTGTSDQIGSVLAGLPVLSAVETSMDDLTATLNLGVAALSRPSTVRVAEVLSASDFAPLSATAPVPSSELPRTGGTPWLPIGGLLLLGALLALREMNRPALRSVRAD